MNNKTTDLERFNLDLNNVVYVYIHTYVAITRWIEAARLQPDMVITFEENGVEHHPPITAADVLAVQDFTTGSALMQLLSQMGRILDRYLKDRVKPLIPLAPWEDDSWFSLGVVEAYSRVQLPAVFDYSAIVSLNLLRATIEDGRPFVVSQPQVLDIAKHVKAFVEDFDARFELEQQQKPKRKVNGNEPEKPIGPGPSATNHPYDRVLDDRPRTSDGPLYSQGPSDPADPTESDDDSDGEDWTI